MTTPMLPPTMIISDRWDPGANERRADADFERHCSAAIRLEFEARRAWRRERVLHERAIGLAGRRAERMEAARVLLLTQTAGAIDCQTQDMWDDRSLALDARHFAMRALALAGAQSHSWWGVDLSDGRLHHPLPDIMRVLASLDLSEDQQRVLADAIGEVVQTDDTL